MLVKMTIYLILCALAVGGACLIYKGKMSLDSEREARILTGFIMVLFSFLLGLVFIIFGMAL